MASIRELRQRIASVRTSGKITGAMKLIASAKLKKAEAALGRALPYRASLEQTLSGLLAVRDDDRPAPLVEERPVRTRLLVAFGSDDGLCGAFNLQLSKAVAEAVREARDAGEQVSVQPVGKRLASLVTKLPGASFREIPGPVTAESIEMLATRLIDDFIGRQVDRVDVIYARFKSIGTQLPVDEQLLPVRPSASDASPRDAYNLLYIYEPGREQILEQLLPLYVRALLHEAWLQSAASEQAARVLSMQLANDNASKLLDGLDLEYNKLRQQGITAELLDIMGGSAR